eukprot:TRINITY_DN12525_c0_g1_i4.p1 TRINITY_DN12525_c0_g1~~TRINITY_DN12525_c0_g1_i4.p1  ORF type:complete len:123 (+),score=8.81 TRINITY_DN12525_c0_g1_i4:71-439(+)
MAKLLRNSDRLGVAIQLAGCFSRSLSADELTHLADVPAEDEPSDNLVSPATISRARARIDVLFMLLRRIMNGNSIKSKWHTLCKLTQTSSFFSFQLYMLSFLVFLLYCSFLTMQTNTHADIR